MTLKMYKVFNSSFFVMCLFSTRRYIGQTFVPSLNFLFYVMLLESTLEKVACSSDKRVLNYDFSRRICDLVPTKKLIMDCHSELMTDWCLLPYNTFNLLPFMFIVLYNLVKENHLKKIKDNGGLRQTTW